MAVISINQTQQVDAAGTLQNMIEAVVTVDPHPGTFTLDVPQAGDWVSALGSAYDSLKSQVNAAYGL